MKFLNLDTKTQSFLNTLFENYEKNLDFIISVRKYLEEKPCLFSDDEIGKMQSQSFIDNRKIICDKITTHFNLNNEFKNKLFSSLHERNVNEFTNNEFYKNIKETVYNLNDFSLSFETIKPYELFVCGDSYAIGDEYKTLLNLSFFNSKYTYQSFKLFDTEWMSLHPNEIETMTVPVQCAKGKVLVLGLGLGYFPYMLSIKDEVSEIHIVEMDVDIINYFNKQIRPFFNSKCKIFIHKADAFHYLKSIKDGTFDMVFADLWHDASDGIKMYVKLRDIFKNYAKTHILYWIEDSILTYLRMLVIGVIRDQYYNEENLDYDEIQCLIEQHLFNVTIRSKEDITNLLSVKGLRNIISQKC